MDRVSACDICRVDLRQLEHFVAVAEARSFTHAVGRAHVVQSALSAAVLRLERDLGVTLLERSTRRVELTEAGQVLLGEARLLLSAAASARDAVLEAAGGERGTLRIGVMHALLTPRVADALLTFRAERPLVHLTVRTDPDGSRGLAQLIDGGELDLAFAVPPAEPGLVRTIPLWSEPMMFVCPEGHRFGGRATVAPADLVDETFVDVPPGWGSRARVDELFTSLGLSRRVAIEVGDVATALELVRVGLGVAVIAPSSGPLQSTLRLVPMSPGATFDVHMLFPAHRTPKRSAVHLSKLVLDP